MPMQTTDNQAPETDDRLAKLAEVFLAERKVDIDAREQSGIEGVWQQCEENYAGIDDRNRGQHSVMKPRYSKPIYGDGPLMREDQPKDSRATAFLRLTARYVDIGKAKVAEIVLPGNDKAFSLKPTPVPEVVEAMEKHDQMTFPADHPQFAGQPMERDPKPDEMAPVNPTDPLAQPTLPPGTPPPSQQPGVQLTVKDAAEQILESAKKKAKKAEKQIYDWMVESKYRRKMRRVLFYMAKLGVGILKAPAAEFKTATVVKKDEQGNFIMERLEKVIPGCKAVCPWDFYPDANCGDDIQNGGHAWERDRLSERQLKALTKLPGYIPQAIQKVIDEGPNKEKAAGKTDPSLKNEPTDTRYHAWFRTGMITKKQAEELNEHINDLTKDGKKLPLDKDELSVTLTIVNESIIRCVMHTLDSGALNYHAIPWQDREGHWVGVGVAEQLFMVQALATAVLRAIINNAGAASGPQIVMARGLISPMDGVDEITPFKLWAMKEDAAVDDIRKSFGIFSIPNEITTLLELANFTFRLAEEATSIPLITQGQSGDTQPDTLGAVTMQNNNANQLLRDVANNLDDYGTEPAVGQYYEHLMLDPDVDDDAKGDFMIEANGSVVMVERSIQNQFIAQMGPAAKDPAYGLNPKKWMSELMEANHYDPKRMQYTDEEQQKLASVPPPEDPRVTAAKIQAEATVKKSAIDTDRDKAYVQAETDRTKVERDMRMQELIVKRELAMLEYAMKQNMTLEQIKSDLAQTTMELTTQKELALRDQVHETKQVAKAAMEPAGKAPNGQAFQK